MQVSPLVREISTASRTNGATASATSRAGAMPAAVKRVSHWLRGTLGARIKGGDRTGSVAPP
eukprot:3661823-Rhodomonas_salina.2